MNTGTLDSADVHAFAPAGERAVAPLARRRRVWPWVLGALALLLGAALAGAALALVGWADATANGVRVVVDDVTWDGGGVAVVLGVVGIGGALLLALLAVTVVVPLVLVSAVVLALLGVALGLGAALLAVAAAAVVVLLPLWLPILLLWWLLRRPAAPGPKSPAATMAS